MRRPEPEMREEIRDEPDSEAENIDMNRIKRQHRAMEVEEFHKAQAYNKPPQSSFQKLLDEPYTPPVMFFHNDPEEARQREKKRLE